jgi:uncharacterized protein (UPF0332 family)/predicted nucleotidyltransferase
MKTGTMLETKERVAHEFVRRLTKSRIADCVIRVLLYGSTLRGDARQDSDIDLLVVAGGELDRVRRECADLSFDLMLESGELVSPLVYCPDDYRDPSYFVGMVKETAREVYAVSDETARRREASDLVDLASRYLSMARSIFREENARGVVDLGYNAAELCVKALLLAGIGPYPKSHAGIVRHFGSHLVKAGIAEAELGRALNRGFERRNRARYDAHAAITPADAREALELADNLLVLARRELDPGSC